MGKEILKHCNNSLIIASLYWVYSSGPACWGSLVHDIFQACVLVYSSFMFGSSPEADQGKLSYIIITYLEANCGIFTHRYFLGGFWMIGKPICQSIKGICLNVVGFGSSYNDGVVRKHIITG